jgi:hypothetical protein
VTRSEFQPRFRERGIFTAGIGAAAALAALVMVALTVGGRVSGHGCVAVSISYSTGGSQLYRCGAAARHLCSSVGKPGGFTGAAGAALRSECRKAGL